MIKTIYNPKKHNQLLEIQKNSKHAISIVSGKINIKLQESPLPNHFSNLRKDWIQSVLDSKHVMHFRKLLSRG